MSEFTPGPWEVHPLHKLAVRHPKYECWIPQNEADANLIAAAPELYEACEQALVNDIAAEGENASNMFPALRKKLEAALKKARGE
jgi:hypothetical protein